MKYLLLALSLLSLNCFAYTATCHFADGTVRYQGSWKSGDANGSTFFKFTENHVDHWLPWSLCEIVE